MHEEIFYKTSSAVKLKVLPFKDGRWLGVGDRHASQHKGSLALALKYEWEFRRVGVESRDKSMAKGKRWC